MDNRPLYFAAAEAFIALVERVPGDAWQRAGLGVWDVRALVGHTSRSLSTVRDYLGARRSTDPLFIYVNFHDTHYPYHHAGLKKILGGDPLPTALISPARTGDL